MQSIDAEFFALIEECARDNASLIQTVKEDMSHMTWQTSKSAQGTAWVHYQFAQKLIDRFFDHKFFHFFNECRAPEFQRISGMADHAI